MATTNFPAALDNNTSLPNPGSGNFTNAPSHADQHDVENDAIKAIEAKIGIGASTPIANRVFRGTGTATSAWAQLDLTSDVTGLLPTASGGTGTASTTGTGSVVFGTSPTIVTPTVASFTNSQHDHSNAAGGGQLSATALLGSGFTLNMKSATNSATISPSNTSQDFASNGVSVTFTVASACNALVTVSLGVSSTSDFEYKPEIRLGGTVIQTYSPAAGAGNASNRAYIRGFTWVVPLTTGVNVISAGANLSAGTGLAIAVGGATIAAIVLGNVTA